MQVIPLTNIPAQTFNVVLDGQYCTIAVYWKQTRLYLDLTVGATVICAGRVCENRANILQVPLRGFKGSLHFWDMEGDCAPLWSRVNERYFLVYVSEGEALPDNLRF